MDIDKKFDSDSDDDPEKRLPGIWCTINIYRSFPNSQYLFY